jgi:hypothetical protein
MLSSYEVVAQQHAGSDSQRRSAFARGTAWAFGFKERRSMTWITLPDYSHEVLGVFARSKFVNDQGRSFIELEKNGPTHIAGLGFAFEKFTISLEAISDPPAEMLSDLVGIVQWSKLRLPEIEGRLYEHYTENRPEYLAECESEGLDADEVARCVPEVKRPDEVWKLIECPFYINGGTWKHPSIAFRCVFDIEHELHISFSNGRVQKIWNE